MRSYEIDHLSTIHDGLTGRIFEPANLARSQRFLFGPHDKIQDEFILFGGDLVRRGLFRLPFEFTIFEFLPSSSGMDNPQIDRIVYLCEQIEGVNLERSDGGRSPIIVFIFPLIRGKDGMWTPVEYGGDPIGIVTGHEDLDMLDEGQFAKIPDIYRDRKGWYEVACGAIALVPAATAMMMSKTSSVEVVHIPDKVRRHREKTGKPELFKFSVVRVPTEKISARHDGGQTHASPILHWRRGHYRRIGLDRLVPVSPCLVGVANRGVAAKVYDGRGNA